MNETDPPASSPTPRPGEALAPLTQESTEVLLRHRDIQALSRSFRRLGEVQDALLGEIRDQQRRTRGRWILPIFGLGAMVLGAGLGLVGAGWLQDRQPNSSVELQFPSEELAAVLANWKSEPVPIEIRGSDGGVDPELLSALVDRIEAMTQSQADDRRLLAGLTDRMVTGELAALEALQRLQHAEMEKERLLREQAELHPPETPDNQAIGVPAEASASIRGDEALDPQDPARYGYPPDAWLGALNGLLAVDGFSKYRFQSGIRVPGQPVLTEVVLFQWGADGLLEGIVQAERVAFEMQQEAWSLTIHLTGGSRNFDGVRSALPAGGLRIFLPEVRAASWLAHFPELGLDLTVFPQEVIAAGGDPSSGRTRTSDPTADPAHDPAAETVADPAADPTADPAAGATGGAEPTRDPGAGAAPTGEQIEAMRVAIDTILGQPQAFGHYRLQKVGGVSDKGFREVVLAWYDRDQKLFKHIEADRLRFLLHQDGWVELRFEQGAFRQGTTRSPFRGDAYRLHLSNQDFTAWRATGAPLEDF